MRTNRRLILNTGTCINDIHNQKVQTKAQAYAYIWMIMRPYVSMDSFHLSDVYKRQGLLLAFWKSFYSFVLNKRFFGM